MAFWYFVLFQSKLCPFSVR